MYMKVQGDNDQEMAQSDRNSHTINTFAPTIVLQQNQCHGN